MKTLRHHSFKVLKYPGPRECLPLDQAIKELRLFPCAAVDILFKQGLTLCALAIQIRNLSLQPQNRMPIAPCLYPSMDRQRDQHQSQNAEHAHSEAPARPEFAGVFVG